MIYPKLYGKFIWLSESPHAVCFYPTALIKPSIRIANKNGGGQIVSGIKVRIIKYRKCFVYMMLLHIAKGFQRRFKPYGHHFESPVAH